MLRFGQLALCAALVTGCFDAPSQGQGGDPGVDAGSSEADAPPGPPGTTACVDGTHACGTACSPDQSNTPDVGCSAGCGGACPAPANGHAVCSGTGTCDMSCNTGFAHVGDQCVAAVCSTLKYACGTYNDGNTSFDCGTCLGDATCGASHTCQIPRDAQEVNDTLAQKRALGDYNDYGDPTMLYTQLSIDGTSDEDWFQFHVTDGFDFGNPDAYVTLLHSNSDTGWLDASHELTVWFKCDGADNGSSVDCNEWYTQLSASTLHDNLGVGCKVDASHKVWAHVYASCATTTDDGTVTVRVKKNAVPRGDTYDLKINVE